MPPLRTSFVLPALLFTALTVLYLRDLGRIAVAAARNRNPHADIDSENGDNDIDDESTAVSGREDFSAVDVGGIIGRVGTRETPARITPTCRRTTGLVGCAECATCG